MTVKNRTEDAILTGMDMVVIPRVEMAVRLTSGSSRREPKTAVQNSDQRDFTWNLENTPPITTSGRLKLNKDQNRIDETRDIENFEDDGFPALRANYDRRVQTHRKNLQKKR